MIAEMPQILVRFWEDLIHRPSGPMAFRFLLQPTMATIAAIKDGLTDARTGRSPYFLTVLTDPVRRGRRLREGAKSTTRILLLGIGMDTIYQLRVFHHFYPGEMAAITLLLGFVPYLLMRGPVARIACWWKNRPISKGPQ